MFIEAVSKAMVLRVPLDLTAQFEIIEHRDAMICKDRVEPSLPRQKITLRRSLEHLRLPLSSRFEAGKSESSARWHGSLTVS